MARVTATRHVQVGGRRVPLKAIKGIMQMLPRVVMEATANQLRVAAEETRELIIDKILAGQPAAPARSVVGRPRRISRSPIPSAERKSFTLAPLSAKWVVEKAARRLDGRTLVATGDYIRGIEVRKATIPGAGVAWGVGLESRNHEPSGLPLIALARILEAGSAAAKIPPRPHWRPTRRIVLRKLKLAVPNIRAAALRQLLREAS